MNKVCQNQNFEVSAETWNSFIDAAQYVKNMQNGMEADGLSDSLPVGQVWVQNDSGNDRDIYDCLALPDLVLTPDTENLDDFDFQDIVFSGEKCTEENEQEPICILQEPLADGEVGKALVIGVTHGDVDIQDTSHRYAKPDTGNPGKLISAESGPIDIMWQEGAQTGDQKVILKMGGSGGGAQSYPFMLFIGKDEDTDEPVLKMKQGSVYLQSIHEDWCNYRYGLCNSFSDDEVIDFDWSTVADGDYMIDGWVKWSKEESLECGISIISDSYANAFNCPFGCGFYSFLIGVVTKETDDDGNVKLSVYKQLAAGHVTISDRYLGLPFVPHIDVTVPGTSTLVKPEDIVATNATLDTTPSYNDAEKKYENLSDPGRSMSKGNTYYCYIKDDGKNREIVWSTTAIQAYQSSGEEESEENIVHTLVAKLNYRSDNLLETEVYHLSPYRGGVDTYKVKVNKDDKKPDFIEAKIKSKDKSISIKADKLESKDILNLEMNVKFMGSLEKYVDVGKDDKDEKKVRWKPEYDSGSVTVEGLGDKCSFFIAQEAETKKLTRWTWGTSEEYKHGVFYWDYSVTGGLPKTTVPPKPTEETEVWVLGGTEAGGLLWYPYNNLSLTLKGSITEVFEITDDEEDPTKKVLRVKTEYDGSIDQFHFLNLDEEGKLALTTFNGSVEENGKTSLMCWDWTNKEPTLTVTPDKDEESVWILSGNKTDGLEWLDLMEYVHKIAVDEEDDEPDFIYNKLVSTNDSIAFDVDTESGTRKLDVTVKSSWFQSEDHSVTIEETEDGKLDLSAKGGEFVGSLANYVEYHYNEESGKQEIRWKAEYDPGDVEVGDEIKYSRKHFQFVCQEQGTKKLSTIGFGRSDSIKTGIFTHDFSSTNPSVVYPPESTEEVDLWVIAGNKKDGFSWMPYKELEISLQGSMDDIFELTEDPEDPTKQVLRVRSEYDGSIDQYHFLNLDKTGKLSLTTFNGDVESNGKKSLMCWDWNNKEPVLTATPEKDEETIWFLSGNKTDGLLWMDLNDYLYTVKVSEDDTEADYLFNKLDSPLKSILITQTAAGAAQKVELEINPEFFTSENDSIRIQNMEDTIDFTINESFFVSSDGTIDIQTDEEGKLDFTISVPGLFALFSSENDSILIQNMEDTIDFTINESFFKSSDGTIDIETDEEGKLDFTISVSGLFSLLSSENDSIRIQNMEDSIDFTINESFFMSSDGTIDIETDEEGKLDFTISVPGLFALLSSENDSIRIQNMEDTIDFTINESFFMSSDGTIDIETDEEGKLDFMISVPGLYALLSSENESIRIQNMEDSIDFTINESFFVSSDGSIEITTDEEGKLDFSSNGMCKVSESDEAGYLGEQFEDSEHIEFESDGDVIKAKISDGAIISSDDSIEIDKSDGIFDLKSNGKVKVTADDTPGYLEEKLMDTETIKMEQSNACYFKADIQDEALTSPSGSIEINKDGVFQLDVNWEKVVIDSSLSGLIQAEYLPDHGGIKLKSSLNGNGILVVNGGKISIIEGQANCVLACTGTGFTWLPYSDCTNACE